MKKTTTLDPKAAITMAGQLLEQNLDQFLVLKSTKEVTATILSNYPEMNQADKASQKKVTDGIWGAFRKALQAAGYITSKENPGHFYDRVKTSGIDDVALPLDGNLNAPLLNKFHIAPPAEVEINIYDPKKQTVNEDVFIPLPSGKFVDQIICEDGGSMPGTTVVVAGGPSVGKTTCTLDLLYSAKVTFLNTLKNKAEREAEVYSFMYLSSEMKRIDLQREQNKKAWMYEVPAVLLNEYKPFEYKAIIAKVILHGYRMLVIDSFQNIVERLKAFCNMKTTEASTFLLDLIEKANQGETETGHATCIYLIQQVTKGGEFVGANNLKHDTTAMWEFKFDENKERYCEFSKSRMNGDVVYKKLYYTLNDKKEVVWDEARWMDDRDQENLITKNKEALSESNAAFELAFANRVDETASELAEAE